MTRYWTADLHLGHQNIIEYCDRPWGTVSHMNEALIQRWNSVVTDADEVMVIGDVVMGHAEQTLKLIPRLHGRKLLVAGNHDRCWVGNTKPGYAQRWRPVYEDAGFEILSDGPWLDVTLGDRTVRVSHFPYLDDERHGDKYAEYRPPDAGHWLIHGHVHTSWLRQDRQVNVGVDMHDYTPITDEKLIRIISNAESIRDRFPHFV